MAKLTGKQIREFRGEGHHLNPVVMIGKGGVSQAVLDSLDQALNAQELIKVKILDATGKDRKEFAEELAGQSASEVVQVLGKTVLLYRKKKKEKEEPAKSEKPSRVPKSVKAKRAPRSDGPKRATPSDGPKRAPRSDGPKRAPRSDGPKRAPRSNGPKRAPASKGRGTRGGK